MMKRLELYLLLGVVHTLVAAYSDRCQQSSPFVSSTSAASSADNFASTSASSVSNLSSTFTSSTDDLSATTTIFAEGDTAAITTYTTTTTTKSAQSSPTDGVFIDFKYAVAIDWDIVAEAGKWTLFEKTPDDSNSEICDWKVVWYKLAKDNIGLSNVPWVPTLKISSRTIWGHSGCKYTGNTEGAGTFSCDDVDEFQCEEDQQASQHFECTQNYPYSYETYVPRVLCWIPV